MAHLVYSGEPCFSSHRFKCPTVGLAAFPSCLLQSIIIFAVLFLERLYLSGGVGPMHYMHTGVLASQESCTRFLSLSLDSSIGFP